MSGRVDAHWPNLIVQTPPRRSAHTSHNSAARCGRHERGRTWHAAPRAHGMKNRELSNNARTTKRRKPRNVVGSTDKTEPTGGPSSRIAAASAWEVGVEAAAAHKEEVERLQQVATAAPKAGARQLRHFKIEPLGSRMRAVTLVEYTLCRAAVRHGSRSRGVTRIAGFSASMCARSTCATGARWRATKLGKSSF